MSSTWVCGCEVRAGDVACPRHEGREVVIDGVRHRPFTAEMREQMRSLADRNRPAMIAGEVGAMSIAITCLLDALDAAGRERDAMESQRARIDALEAELVAAKDSARNWKGEAMAKERLREASETCARATESDLASVTAERDRLKQDAEDYSIQLKATEGSRDEARRDYERMKQNDRLQMERAIRAEEATREQTLWISKIGAALDGQDAQATRSPEQILANVVSIKAENAEYLAEMRVFMVTMRDAFREAADGLTDKIDSLDASEMERSWKGQKT